MEKGSPKNNQKRIKRHQQTHRVPNIEMFSPEVAFKTALTYLDNMPNEIKQVSLEPIVMAQSPTQTNITASILKITWVEPHTRDYTA